MVIVIALISIAAIKPYYGGEVVIRLNEPDDFSYNPSSYSNMVFYSFIYENFFYLRKNGEIDSNVFREYTYDKNTFTLNLILKENSCFSNGKLITAEHIEGSLKLYLDMNSVSSRKLRRLIKKIKTIPEENRVVVELLQDDPGILGSLTTPELVVITGSDDVFSGMFYPVEWDKNQHILLKPNPFYPGGRSYLDSVKVIFYDMYYPDVFLADPGFKNEKFSELDSGVYQNLYLVFPEGKEGKTSGNARIALYSMLKNFFKPSGTNPKIKPTPIPDAFQNLMDLNSLTSNDESPVTLNIQTFPDWKVRSVLQYSKVKLYILSSLKSLEKPLADFLEKNNLPIETIFLSDNQLSNFMNTTPISYLMMAKTFNKQEPIEEKVKVILKEMSFERFDESYLKLLNQLDEVQNLKNEELTMDLVSRITEKIIDDGIILPLFQKRYSLYVKKNLAGIDLDYYGKPLFQSVRFNRANSSERKGEVE